MHDEDAYTSWVVTITNPSSWLSAVAWEMGFVPRKDPMAMSFAEINQAVANVICPPRLHSECGVGVAYVRGKDWRVTLEDSCLVVFHSPIPRTSEEIAPLFHGADFEPAYGDDVSLMRLLATGGRRGKSVGRPLFQGLPVGGSR